MLCVFDNGYDLLRQQTIPRRVVESSQNLEMSSENSTSNKESRRQSRPCTMLSGAELEAQLRMPTLIAMSAKCFDHNRTDNAKW